MADRRWLTFISVGVVAVFVVAVSIFPSGLFGSSDWSSKAQPLHSAKRCGNTNKELAHFIKQAQKADKAGTDLMLPHKATTLDEFLVELKTSLDKPHHQLDQRAHLWLFDEDMQRPHPACSGDWMEFGVYTGGSINVSATWRRNHCGNGCPPVYGFDTFTGLPEAWSQDGAAGTFGKNAFSLAGVFPAVEPNVQLVKGLFSDSLPPFLRLEADMQEKKAPVTPLAYVHVDCDLYAGAKDIFTLLSDKIVPGTIILFDELVNYKLFKDHEVKAFFEWLTETKARVATIGIKGPLEGRTHSMDIDMVVREEHQHHQGAVFVVVSKPGTNTRVGW